MTATRDALIQPFLRACLAAIFLGQATAAMSQAPIIQPGAPGDSLRELSAEEAVEIGYVEKLVEPENLLAEARQTNQHLQELLKKPDKTQSQMANIAVMIANLNKTLVRVDKLIVTQGPQIEQALANLRVVSADLKQLTGDLKQHPSQLIFSQPPSESEVSK